MDHYRRERIVRLGEETDVVGILAGEPGRVGDEQGVDGNQDDSGSF
ncbi:hypothetical protein [Amycolatopsis sp. NPDC003676]